ncbi:hypothetical protein J6590_090025 [Homalodisca vitripennis]|nr:hypothetical protein J6590_090025 [Homalodisca vitripennis]
MTSKATGRDCTDNCSVLLTPFKKSGLVKFFLFFENNVVAEYMKFHFWSDLNTTSALALMSKRILAIFDSALTTAKTEYPDTATQHIRVEGINPSLYTLVQTPFVCVSLPVWRTVLLQQTMPWCPTATSITLLHSNQWRI